jgi:hypothetical protein
MPPWRPAARGVREPVAVGRAVGQVTADHPDPHVGATLLRRDRDDADEFRHLCQRHVDGLVGADAVERRGDALGCSRTDPSLQSGAVRLQRCRTHYAANLMSVTPKTSWPVGQGTAALHLRPARRSQRARAVRPRRRRPDREAPRRGHSPRRSPRRHPCVHREIWSNRKIRRCTDVVICPTATPSSGSSAPFSPNSTTNVSKAAASSVSTSSPAPRQSRTARSRG